MLFAVQPGSRNAYSALFRERVVGKTHEAIAARPQPGQVFARVHESRLVEGRQFFRMCEAPGGANSQTRIELLETRAELATTGSRH